MWALGQVDFLEASLLEIVSLTFLPRINWRKLFLMAYDDFSDSDNCILRPYDFGLELQVTVTQ